MCCNCSAIKHNSFYKTLSPFQKSAENNKYKRETYMNEKELRERLQNEKKERQKANKRELYLKEKIEKGMHKFSKDDDHDFQAMFSEVDKSQLHPDMKVLYDAQAENIQRKGPKGRRWHPR